MPTSIADLLIRPVQRVPRIKLLLEQIVAATPVDHPDRAETERAFEHVAQVAAEVNEAIRRREAIEATFQLANEFTNRVEDLTKPGRYLLARADDVHVGWPPPELSSESKLKQVVLLLFNDVLLVAEKNVSCPTRMPSPRTAPARARLKPTLDEAPALGG